MMYERLALIRDLLADDGSIYVHCDWRVSAYIRLILDEIFGKENFRNEIVWHYGGRGGKAVAEQFPRNHDVAIFYGKSTANTFNMQHIEKQIKFEESGYRIDEEGRCYRTAPRGHYTDESIRELEAEGRVHITRSGKVRIKYFERYDGEYVYENKVLGDTWNDIPDAMHFSKAERFNYPTQKPEALLTRIIKASSNEGDLVADFFSGSGTTAAAAEKLGRKWICADLGKFAIHTTRKRMIGVQRELKVEGKNYRAFEVLNLGKYERQHYIGVNPGLSEKQQAQKEIEYQDLILTAYSAQPVKHSTVFHGKKADHMVVIGPIDIPVVRSLVEEVIKECQKMHVTRVDILGFEFEMGLFPNILEEARGKGITIFPKYIPSEVFDKRAVEKKEIVFHDVAYVEVKPLVNKRKGKPHKLTVELTDFSVYYSQDNTSDIEEDLKVDKSKVIADSGQIVEITKNKQGKVTRKQLTKKWSDWVDYWAVDFDFGNRPEVITEIDPETGKTKQRKTGNFVFENEWQSFRTKNEPLELNSIGHECKPGKRKIAVKVVDIFGNDTMQIVEVKI